MALHIWDHFWDLRVKECPCDVHFCDWLDENEVSGKAIFHFGTGGHHILGLHNVEKDRKNVILDGATSALDEGGEARLMATLVAALEGSTLVSVGLRPGLEALHDRKLVLSRGERGAHLASVPLRPAVISRSP